MTYQDHPQDLKLYKYFSDRAKDLVDASGAVRSWQPPVDSAQFSVHLLGTCRMGNDPKTSVVDKNNRAHDVKNLFVVDASFFPSSAAVNPGLTIAAQALRVADHIVQNDLGLETQDL